MTPVVNATLLNIGGIITDTANPIPVYVTNFVGGASAGVIIALSGLINNATGTATPIAGLAVMYGFNDPMKVTIVAVSCAAVGVLCGYLGSLVFKKYNIKTVDQLSVQGKEESSVKLILL